MVLEQRAVRAASLLSILRREFGLSSGLIKRLKWHSAFWVDGQPQHTNFPVQPGQCIRVLLDETPEGFPAEQMPLDILLEDESCIAVDKPAGLLVHPSPNRNKGTLANGLLGYFERTGQKCGVHPVTRLDRDTFGIVLFAKNAHVHEQFRCMLRAGQLHKTYYAAVFGGPEAEHGQICLPVYKPGGGSLLRTVDPRGQAAETKFCVLRRFPETALLELHPLTGRTHQLRLHCMASGFPILGDPQYATDASRAFSAQAGLTYQQLCAGRLEFRHPITGEGVCIRSRQSVRFHSDAPEP